MPILMEKEEEGMLSPILAHGGVRFMWIKHNNLYRIPLRGSPRGLPRARTHRHTRATWSCQYPVSPGRGLPHAHAPGPPAA